VIDENQSREMHWRYLGDTLEIQWRYIGDTLEIHWRYIGDTREIHGRYTGDKEVPIDFTPGEIGPADSLMNGD
jgi:hypothetical protein